MDAQNKIANKHNNYNGSYSCTCPGHAGPFRCRVADMVRVIDNPGEFSGGRIKNQQKAKYKRLLSKRAKAKVKRFVEQDRIND